MTLPHDRATAWLAATYGGLVQLAAPHPVHETATAWLLSCRTVPQPGYPQTPMLAASVVVPKDGGTPFHPAPSDPLGDLAPRPPPPRRRRSGSRDSPAGSTPAAARSLCTA
ncbi:YrhB domain-containing protein [Streptomyces phaeoluteigriseus]